MAPLLKLVESWSRRTPRERRLAVVVAGLLLVFIAALTAKGALRILSGLDGEIARLSNEILNASRQVALRDRVEARFAHVANQHSSAWTESEIRDRLRQEIYRLSNRVPPALDATGIPISTNNQSGFLVEVPELGGGRLIETGEGYREYQIEFSIPPVPILDLTAYLERLLESPQSLRIDRIDLRRDPGRTEFASSLQITRTVVDDPGGNATTGVTIALEPADWTCDECTVQRDAEAGLVLQGDSGGGNASLARTLPAASRVEVELELASTSAGRIGAAADGIPLTESGDTALKDDGEFYRYRFQLAVPESPSGRVAMSLPILSWSQPDATLRIRRIQYSLSERMGDGM